MSLLCDGYHTQRQDWDSRSICHPLFSHTHSFVTSLLSSLGECLPARAWALATWLHRPSHLLIARGFKCPEFKENRVLEKSLNVPIRQSRSVLDASSWSWRSSTRDSLTPLRFSPRCEYLRPSSRRHMLQCRNSTHNLDYSHILSGKVCHSVTVSS